VKTFEAFVKGRLALRVIRSSSGECWGGALAVRRSDAWRCHSGRQIYDPCFSRPAGTAKIVACPVSYPWVRRAVEIELSSELPYRFGNRHGPATAGPPWAIQTTDGKNCLAYTGLTRSVGGHRISYGCSGGGGLLGVPRKASKLWTIRYVHGSKQPAWIGIRVAWW
jgi:hypothetical protein